MTSFFVLILLVAFDAGNYGAIQSYTSTTLITLYSRDSNVQMFDPTQATIQSLIIVSIFIGCFIGAILAGYLMDHFTRKAIVIVASGLALIFNSLLLIPMAWWYWFVLKILVGIPSAIMTTVDPAWISEVASVEQRGLLTGCYEISTRLGQLLEAVMLLIIGESSTWQISFIPPIVFCLSELLLTIFCTKESSIRKIVDKDKKANEVTWKQFFTKKYGRMLAIALTFGPSVEGSGKNAIVGYATKNFQYIFQSVGQTYSSIFGMLLICGANFIFTCVGVPFVNKLGRRWLLFQGDIACAICLVLFIICYGLSNSNPVAWLLITASIVFLLGFETGPGPIFYIISGELYGEAVKPRCSAINYCMKFSFDLLVVLVYPFFENILWAAYVMFLFILIGFATVVYIALPETRHKTLSEVEKEMFSKWACQKNQKQQTNRYGLVSINNEKDVKNINKLDVKKAIPLPVVQISNNTDEKDRKELDREIELRTRQSTEQSSTLTTIQTELGLNVIKE